MKWSADFAYGYLKNYSETKKYARYTAEVGLQGRRPNNSDFQNDDDRRAAAIRFEVFHEWLVQASNMVSPRLPAV